jgi:hypothetical protein
MKSVRLTILSVLATIIVGAYFTSFSYAAGIPNLKGKWKSSMSGFGFQNILQDGVNPQAATDSGVATLGFQKGRSFAGRFIDNNHEVKLTGVILEDNTVHMQVFSYHSRGVFVGKYSVINGVQTIKGAANLYDDLNLSSDPGISTMYFVLTKVN